MNLNFWQDLSNDWQDFIIFLAYLFPIILVGSLLFYRLRPLGIIKTLLKRYKKINLLFILILGICLSISIAIKATTHSYKMAMAKVANRFELVVTAPGSKVDMMLSTVYLQPTATPLLQGDIYKKISNDEKIAITAPIAYGDSYNGFPVIGSTNSFIKYLSENKVSGSYFNNKDEAIIGAGVDLKIGDTFVPQHGVHKNFGAKHTKIKTVSIKTVEQSSQGQTNNTNNAHQKKKTTYFCPDSNNTRLEKVLIKKDTGKKTENPKITELLNQSPTTVDQSEPKKISDEAQENTNEQEHEHVNEHTNEQNDSHGHHHAVLKVVGKMPITHSPWDKAIITPVESVWSIHGLPSGHPPNDNSLGEPFDMDYFSGTPAILVHPKKRFHSFSLSKKYTNGQSMAFIPPTVLNKLNAQLDDVTDIFSRVATLTTCLVLSLSTITIALLGKLFEKNLQLLQLLGSPKRFIVSIMWGYVTTLAFFATIMGCLLGYLITLILSNYIEKQLSILLQVNFGWEELILCSIFFAATSLIGLVIALGRDKLTS